MSDLKTQLNRFELYLREDKALSENTVISYCRDIRQFSEWLEQDRTSQLNSASKEDISSYLQYLQGMGKSPSTVSRSAASLRGPPVLILLQESHWRNMAENFRVF